MRWVDGLPCSIQDHRTGWQKKEGRCNHFSTTIQVGDMGNYTFKLVKSHKVVPPNVLSLFINSSNYFVISTINHKVIGVINKPTERNHKLGAHIAKNGLI